MRKRYIAIFLICFVIGAGIIVQARLTDGEKLYASSDALTELDAQIKSVKDSTEEIKQSTKDVKKSIKEYENRDYAAEEVIVKGIEKDLADSEIMAGTADVRGSGVTIAIDDGTRPLASDEDVGDVLVHDQDLLNVVNELRESGAEAISINGHRVTALTPITCAGYVIKVNHKSIARPFKVKAIGRSSDMVKKLTGVGGYGYVLKSCGIKFNMKTKKNLLIKGLE